MKQLLQGEELESFIDFLTDSPDAFEEVDGKLATGVLYELMRKELPMGKILLRIAKSFDFEDLLNKLALEAKADPQKYQELCLAIARKWIDLYECTPDAEEALYRALNMADGFSALMATNPEVLFDEKSMLQGSAKIDTSRYWQRRVRERIVTNDFRRAWDELKKAANGLLGYGQKAPAGVSQKDYEQEGEYRCFEAPVETLRELVRELYHAMEQATLLPAYTKTMQPPNNRRKYYPGEEFIFALQYGGDWWVKRYFNKTQGQAYLIANHFARQQNDRRNQKRKHLLTSYERWK